MNNKYRVRGMEGLWRTWDEAKAFCLERGISTLNIYEVAQ